MAKPRWNVWSGCNRPEPPRRGGPGPCGSGCGAGPDGAHWAIIARKTIRAPFRARVGLADVHIGQYLNEGTELTTLQGIDQAANVDFTVSQSVAGSLRVGEPVAVISAGRPAPIAAQIVAIDARVDPTTRNALVRARIPANAPAPGASVRVEVPVGPMASAVSIPVSALRKALGEITSS